MIGDGRETYAYSTLKSMRKEELISVIRCLENNLIRMRTTNDIQYENCKKLLAEERNKAIDDFATDMLNKIEFEEKWLMNCHSNNADTDIMISALKTFCRSNSDRLKVGGKG